MTRKYNSPRNGTADPDYRCNLRALIACKIAPDTGCYTASFLKEAYEVRDLFPGLTIYLRNDDHKKIIYQKKDSASAESSEKH